MIANVVASSHNGDESRSSGIYFLVSMVLEILFGILASIIAMWFSAIVNIVQMQALHSLLEKQK